LNAPESTCQAVWEEQARAIIEGCPEASAKQSNHVAAVQWFYATRLAHDQSELFARGNKKEIGRNYNRKKKISSTDGDDTASVIEGGGCVVYSWNGTMLVMSARHQLLRSQTDDMNA
jgi:hypothetical protein